MKRIVSAAAIGPVSALALAGAAGGAELPALLDGELVRLTARGFTLLRHPSGGLAAELRIADGVCGWAPAGPLEHQRAGGRPGPGRLQPRRDHQEPCSPSARHAGHTRPQPAALPPPSPRFRNRRLRTKVSGVHTSHRNVPPGGINCGLFAKRLDHGSRGAQ